jgi:hypothetical protein
VAISHGCRGVAARACGLVNLEPTKVLYTSAIFLKNFDWNLVSKKTLSGTPVVCFKENYVETIIICNLTCLFI